jgi:hypothetical protein
LASFELPISTFHVYDAISQLSFQTEVHSHHVGVSSKHSISDPDIVHHFQSVHVKNVSVPERYQLKSTPVFNSLTSLQLSQFVSQMLSDKTLLLIPSTITPVVPSLSVKTNCCKYCTVFPAKSVFTVTVAAKTVIAENKIHAKNMIKNLDCKCFICIE